MDPNSGTPFPCPLPVPLQYFKGFWNGSDMGVWVAGGSHVLGGSLEFLLKLAVVFFLDPPDKPEN